MKQELKTTEDYHHEITRMMMMMMMTTSDDEDSIIYIQIIHYIHAGVTELLLTIYYY